MVDSYHPLQATESLKFWHACKTRGAWRVLRTIVPRFCVTRVTIYPEVDCGEPATFPDRIDAGRAAKRLHERRYGYNSDERSAADARK